MMNVRENISRNIRTLRVAAGMTQVALAERLGVRRPAVSEIESAKRGVSIEEAIAIAEVFGVDPERVWESGPDRCPACGQRVVPAGIDAVEVGLSDRLKYGRVAEVGLGPTARTASEIIACACRSVREGIPFSFAMRIVSEEIQDNGMTEDARKILELPSFDWRTYGVSREESA